MLNFDGVPLSFVPGRNVPNKEPPTNRFVVEKLYRVHRKRMLKMEPIVDCHVEIPDFLTNQNWKQITQQHRRDEITRENEVIYKRIAKAENTESLITRENREHAHHVENELKLMKRLKRMGRIRDILKTQRENEDMLRRIDKARPAYGLKSIKEWYKHHELFKKGRRSDPTAGHLGFRNMKGLWPKPLPDISSPEQSPTKSFVSRGDMDRGNSPPNFSLVSDPLSMTIDGHEDDMSIDSKVLADINNQASLYGSRSPGMSPANYSQSQPNLDSIHEMSTSTKGTKGKKGKKKKKKAIGQGLASVTGGKSATGSGKGNKNVTLTDTNGSRATTSESKRSLSRVSTPGSIRLHSWANSDEAIATRNAALEMDGYNTLLVREMPVPFASRTSDNKRKTCLVQFLMEKGSADKLLVIVREAVAPYTESSRRVTLMDKVFQLVSTEGTTSMFSDSSMISDLSGMREMFMQMFHEVDSDGNGHITFDEFMTLMDRFNMGLDESELRKILAAADENGNGVVEADEFYPLILDLVLAYRTFNAAKMIMIKKETLEEEANVRLDSDGEKLEEIADTLLMKVQSFDSKKSGFVRHTDLKKALTTLAGPSN